jgi:hypothetical protein
VALPILLLTFSATVAGKTEDTPPSPGISFKQDAWGLTFHSPSLLELKIREVIRAVDQEHDEHLDVPAIPLSVFHT